MKIAGRQDIRRLNQQENTVSAARTRRIRWGRHIARMAETQNAYNLVVKSEIKIKLGKRTVKHKHDIGRKMKGFVN